MRRNLTTLPNLLTLLRLILIPVLWVLAGLGQAKLVGIGMITAALTDALDGIAARRLGQVSDFGAKFDAFADNLLIPSAFFWLLMLRPEVAREYPVILFLPVALYVVAITIGLIKFRRFANLHLYSTRTAGVIEYAFMIHSFLLSESYFKPLFFLAMTLFTISSIEMITLQLTRSHVHAHMGSLLKVWAEDRRAIRQQLNEP